MGVNLTNEEYANLIRERDAAINKVSTALLALGKARSGVVQKTAADPNERRLLNEVLAMIDRAMDSI